MRILCQVELAASFSWLSPLPTSYLDGVLIRHLMSARGKKCFPHFHLSLTLVSFAKISWQLRLSTIQSYAKSFKSVVLRSHTLIGFCMILGCGRPVQYAIVEGPALAASTGTLINYMQAVKRSIIKVHTHTSHIITQNAAIGYAQSCQFI